MINHELEKDEAIVSIEVKSFIQQNVYAVRLYHEKNNRQDSDI